MATQQNCHFPTLQAQHVACTCKTPTSYRDHMTGTYNFDDMTRYALRKFALTTCEVYDTQELSLGEAVCGCWKAALSVKKGLSANKKSSAATSARTGPSKWA